MKYLLSISLLLLTACGKPIDQRDPRSVVGVNQQFVPYINMYISNKGRGLDYDIPMGFTDLPGDTVGVCYRWSNGYRQIQIDQDYWENEASENERISLMAHELGHCDLNRNHSTDWNSIMYEYNLGSINFYELFNPGIYSSKTMIHDDCVEDIEVK